MLVVGSDQIVDAERVRAELHGADAVVPAQALLVGVELPIVDELAVRCVPDHEHEVLAERCQVPIVRREGKLRHRAANALEHNQWRASLHVPQDHGGVVLLLENCANLAGCDKDSIAGNCHRRDFHVVAEEKLLLRLVCNVFET